MHCLMEFGGRGMFVVVGTLALNELHRITEETKRSSRGFVGTFLVNLCIGQPIIENVLYKKPTQSLRTNAKTDL